jgi:SH3 domain-containing YSC84-like protein 1
MEEYSMTNNWPALSVRAAALVLVTTLIGAGVTVKTASAATIATPDLGITPGEPPIAVKAQRDVADAAQVIAVMKRDKRLNELLEHTDGVLVVPHYLRGTAAAGAEGSSAVLLIRPTGGVWSDPAFFSIGGIDITARAASTDQAVAVLLMSEKSVNAFENNNNSWSANTGTGFKIVSYPPRLPTAAQADDLVVWSDTAGVFAGASGDVTDIRPDANENRAYYWRNVTPREIFAGAVGDAHYNAMKDALQAEQASG